MRKKADHIKLALWGGIGLVIFIIVLPILKALKGGVKGVTDMVSGVVTGAVDSIKTNSVYDRHANMGPDLLKLLDTCAENIYKAYHSSPWDEDEDTAVRNLNQAKTQSQVIVLCDFYKAKYGKSLKEESLKYLTDGIQAIGMGKLGDINRVTGVVKQYWY